MTLRIAAFALLICGCPARSGNSPPVSGAPYDGFSPGQTVEIRGYHGIAMEPFITGDGQLLFFNNSNDAAANTDLHVARRVADLTFDYVGPMSAVNTGALEGVPSVDASGELYFVSTRSYETTLSTVYRSQLDGGGLEIVPGVSRKQGGIVNFDAEISSDGQTLWIVDGDLTGGPVPKEADLVITQRQDGGFVRAAKSAELLAAVNSSALEYAPAISADGLELFFTRFDPKATDAAPAIFRTTRPTLDARFATPQRVTAAEGFVEGPTLTADGKALYFHQKRGDTFVIVRATR